MFGIAQRQGDKHYKEVIRVSERDLAPYQDAINHTSALFTTLRKAFAANTPPGSEHLIELLARNYYLADIYQMAILYKMKLPGRFIQYQVIRPTLLLT